MVPLVRRLPVMLAALAACELLGDALFVGADPGWVWGLFLAALLGLAVARHPLVLGSGAGRGVVVATLALAASLAYACGWLAILLVAVGLVSVIQIGRGGRPVAAVPWLREQAGMGLRALPALLRDGRLAARWSRRHPQRQRRSRFASWWLPTTLGAVFVVLFAIANPVIGTWLSTVVEWIATACTDLPGLPAPARILLWSVVALCAWAILRLRRPVRPPIHEQAMPVRQRAPRDRSAMVLRCLAVFNGIFAIQSLLDLAYLWGGVALPQGLTYASYAHRGAYPLVATALLAALFVLVCFRPGGALQGSTWARRLVFAWLGQNVFLVVCALWRLHLYVDVYSLTLWRVTALAWMVLVAIGLALIGWRILADRGNRWLIDANCVALGALLGLLCFVDLRGHIAWHNVTRCQEAGGPAVAIDLDYLQSLGLESGPALAWLASNSRDREVAERAARLAHADAQNARRLLGDWRNWTVVRARVARAEAE